MDPKYSTIKLTKHAISVCQCFLDSNKSIVGICKCYTHQNDEVFTFNMGMIIPQCGEIGTGKFLHSSLKAHFIFTIHGLAVGVKIKFPHSRLRLSWGNFVFTPPAAPFMVKIKCAFRDSWGNLFFPFRGFATQGEKSRPYFSTLRDWHNFFRTVNNSIFFCEAMLQNFRR